MATSADPGVLAGWASADITPQPPCWMGGYAARSGPAASIHDRLFAQAIAFGNPAKPFVVVVCDVIAINEEVRGRITSSLPDATVWVAATHTHSGPETGDVLPNSATDPAALKCVIDGAACAAEAAVRSMRPVLARWASGPVLGVAGNRDHPDRTARIDLDLLCLYAPETLDAPPIAVFGSFPCHPTVLGADNLSISAELAGAVRRHLQFRLGSEAWIALATGAAGDISTRHTRREQTFREVDRLGACIADQAITLVHTSRPLRLGPPQVVGRRITLRAKNSPVAGAESRREGLSRQYAALAAAGDIGGARTLETAMQALTLAPVQAADIEATIEVGRVGELALAAIPGELYAELGERLRRALAPALIVGYANGYIGYIPNCEAFQDDIDYEVVMSRVAPGQGERIADLAVSLVAGIDKVRS